jgi:hypothetical protein
VSYEWRVASTRAAGSMMRGILALLIAVSGGAFGGTAAGQASGQKGKSGPQPVVNSWALTPTGTDTNQPSTRVFLSYDVIPGSVIRDSVTLWNYSNVPLTFQIYATDAFNDASGAFDLLPGSKPPTDAGSWVTLTYTQATLQARHKLDIPMTLAVPPNARPGDHAGAVLAASAVEGTTANGQKVNLDRRTGSRLYVRVKGALSPALVVENIRTVYHPALNPLGGSLDATYTVRNAGNVRLTAHQDVAAKGPFGLATKRHKLKDLPELLPGNQITLHTRFSSVPALIRATADIHLRPFSPDPDVTGLGAVRRGGHTWAIPWSVIAFALMLWLARRSYRAILRRRQERAALTPPPPQERMAPVP